MSLFILFLAFTTSVIGSICGVGGGVILKPVLDSFGIMSVSAVSFLSGCTVLSMSCVSLARKAASKKLDVKPATVLPMGIGAAAGGILGSSIFSLIRKAAPSDALVGFVQSVVLLALTVGTFFYMRRSYAGTAKTHSLTNKAVCALIGILLGLLSSFLGIGGGPFNLAFLAFFFSMDAKEGASNSLLIILLSQIASLIRTVSTGSVPDFPPLMLVMMAAGGIAGALFGQRINRTLELRHVQKLFMILLSLVSMVCLYNSYRYGIKIF